MIQNKDQWIIVNGIKIKSKNHVVIEDGDTIDDIFESMIGEEEENGHNKNN